MLPRNTEAEDAAYTILRVVPIVFRKVLHKITELTNMGGMLKLENNHFVTPMK